MQPTFDSSVVAQLNRNIEEESQKQDGTLLRRERASKRVRMIMQGTAKRLNLDGEVKMFGSYSNGFKTGSSDLDVVFVGNVGPDNTISVLGKFASMVQDFGFENLTKIFQANVPLVKFTDKQTQMEIDFCINNELGVRNSELLYAYCKYDERVLHLGRLVKDWAKRHELVGTADGCLNSYAYMLLVIHFLQNLQPPVVPNLQMLATEPVNVVDNKWGSEDYWDTKFEEDVESLPPSSNNLSTGELLMRFFYFFTCEFDWKLHAVCMRLNGPGVCIDKYSLFTGTNEDQWYIEDPFDLKHNLAGKCTRAGRKRILDRMCETLKALRTGSSWSQVCPTYDVASFFLKCRISQGVTPEALLEEFDQFDMSKLHFPKPDENGRRLAQAFLEFSTAAARRRAHTKNETYVADCQLQLHYSSQHCLAEAVTQGVFSTFDVASYKMQRKVLAAREMMGQRQQQQEQQRQQQQAPSHQRPDLGRGSLGYQDGEGIMMPTQSLMVGDPSHYAYFGLMSRSRQQAGPAHPGPLVPGHGLPQPGAADGPQQHQQLQQSQKKGAAEQPAQTTPKPAGLVSSGTATQRSDARAKASEQRAPGTQIRNLPLQAAQSAPDAARSRAADHQWLKVPLEVDLPKTCPKLLSDAQYDAIQAFLRCWEVPKSIAEMKAVTEQTIQVEVKALSPDEPLLLSREQWRVARDVKAWCESLKR